MRIVLPRHVERRHEEIDMPATDADVQMPAPRTPQPAEAAPKPQLLARPRQEYWDLEQCAWVPCVDARQEV